jgi:hypothetical protein
MEPVEPEPAGSGPRWRWPWFAAAALAALAVFLLLTGGGDSEEDTVRDVLARLSTSHDPSICDELMTEHWLALQFPSNTQTPLERCRAVQPTAVKSNTPGITDVSVDGDTATATARMTSLEVGDVAMTLTLVHEDGWRADSLLSVDVDAPKVFAAMRARDSDPLRQCLYDYAIEHVTSEELGRALTAGNQDYLSGAWPQCKVAFETTAISGDDLASHGGLPLGAANCVADKIRAATNERDVHALFNTMVAQEPPPAKLIAAREAAVDQCT